MNNFKGNLMKVEKLKQLSEGWDLIADHHLNKEFKFDDFSKALKFTNEVAEISEIQRHHPDIFLSYGKVIIDIFTHDTGTITDKDFKLALEIDRITKNEESSEIVQNLIKQLKKGNDLERMKAATRLGNIRSDKATLSLIKALKDKNKKISARSATALGKIKDRRAIKPLIRNFKSSNSNIRYASKNAIVQIGKESVNELIINSINPNVHVRELSIEALGELKDKKALNVVIEATEDDEYSVRWRAARALGELEDFEAIEALKVLLKDGNDKVRDESIRSLEIFENKINDLFNILDIKLKNNFNGIYSKETTAGFSYFYSGRLFLQIQLYNPYKVRVKFFMNNNKFAGTYKIKSDPKWGIMTIAYLEELSIVLEYAKESLRLIQNRK